MTCDQIQPLLEAFADHDLSPLTQWRVRRHLTQCPACTAELAESVALTARVRDWQNVPAPSGLEAGIAARLPAATPAPARPTMRRAAVGLSGLAAALAAAFWLIPGQPGRPTVAFAEVEKAMQNVQSASYDIDTRACDAQGRVFQGGVTHSLHVWVRRSPAADSLLDKSRSERFLVDRRGGIYHSLKKDLYLKYPTHQSIASEVDRKLRQLTEPINTKQDPSAGSFGRWTPWQQQKATLNRMPCLKFTRDLIRTIEKKPDITHFNIWVDAETLLVLRVEIYGDMAGRTQGYRERSVVSNFRYNEAAPSGVFDWSPPPGAKVQGHW